MKNISLLETIIPQIRDANIEISISDNASTDETVNEINRFIDEHPYNHIQLYSQNENVGLTKNVISSVQRSSADYILILGDDDYLNKHYLQTSIDYLNQDIDISCILPSFEGITEDGKRLGVGRDLGMKTKVYDSGIDNVVDNSHRAHQISGIILKRKGLFETMREKNITNLYPQIFMVAYSCLNGKCIHIPEYPILVTQTNNKAWRYDDVGLLNDVFQNLKALDLGDKQRFKIERKFVCLQSWRALRYFKNPLKQIMVIFQIAYGPYTSRRGSIFFPAIISYYWAYKVLSAIKARICKLCR